MTKSAVYLLQFIGTSMIVGGGTLVARDMVAGEHNLVGWCIGILGIIFLIAGAGKPTKTKR